MLCRLRDLVASSLASQAVLGTANSSLVRRVTLHDSSKATSAQDRYRTDNLKKVVTLIEAIGSKESGTGGSNQGRDRQWELRRAGNL